MKLVVAKMRTKDRQLFVLLIFMALQYVLTKASDRPYYSCEKAYGKFDPRFDDYVFDDVTCSGKLGGVRYFHSLGDTLGIVLASYFAFSD